MKEPTTKEAVGMNDQPKEDKITRPEFRSLENQVKQLQQAVRTLTIISDMLAKKNGIKIERYIDLMVVSQI